MRFIGILLMLNLFSCQMDKEINKINSQNEKTGFWIENSNEDSWIGYYLKNEKEGDWTFYRNERVLKIAHFKNGKKNGKAYKYDTNGNLKVCINFENDRVHGKVFFYEASGEVITIYNYIYDKLHEVELYILTDNSPSKNKDFIPEF